MSSFEYSKRRIRNQEFVNGKNKNRVKSIVGLKACWACILTEMIKMELDCKVIVGRLLR